MVAEILDNLHDSFAGCDTLAFADLSTQMVLVANSATSYPREALDALCAEAALMLGNSKKLPIGTQPNSLSLLAQSNETKVFLRATAEPSDVLCCVCGPQVDLAAFIPAAQSCLAQISGGE